MYSQLSLLISALIYSTTHSLAILKPPDLIISPTSLAGTNNLTTTLSVATIQHPRTNISDSPLNFLGVNCYHLLSRRRSQLRNLPESIRPCVPRGRRV